MGGAEARKALCEHNLTPGLDKTLRQDLNQINSIVNDAEKVGARKGPCDTLPF